MVGAANYRLSRTSQSGAYAKRSHGLRILLRTSHAAPPQQMLWCFAYRLGIRKGELLKIRIEWLLPYWNQEEPFIKIPGFDEFGNRITKSGQPHTIPIHHPELRSFVEMAPQ